MANEQGSSAAKPEYAEGRGRTEQRRAALEITATAQELADLKDFEIRKLPIPEALRDEVMVAHRTEGKSSRKRQVKYLAGLLRDDDASYAEARAFLNGLRARTNAAERDFRRLERWRDALCAPESYERTLAEVGAALPKLDLVAVAQLAQRFHGRGDKASFRAVFRLLHEASEA